MYFSSLMRQGVGLIQWFYVRVQILYVLLGQLCLCYPGWAQPLFEHILISGILDVCRGRHVLRKGWM